jgi:tripartite-type tricarboxylate transporter receptor subunit TctC
MRIVAILTLAATVFLAPGAHAQDWPSRPLTMVVAAAAGGPIDVFGRLLADRMGDILGQRVVVENIGGGGGTLGAARVVTAQPDGYTFLLGTVATHANPRLMEPMPPYDAETDFAPVGLLAEIPLVLMTRRDFPANNLAEFIAYAKAHENTMNYGSAGVGSASHLACVMLNKAMGTKLQHVPYRGTALAMQDLQAARLDFQCEIALTAVQSVKAKTVKVLATLSQERSPVLPDVPTAAESGLKGLNAYTWTANFLPKGTPPAVIAKLNAAASAAIDTPALRLKLEELGAVMVKPERRSPQALAAFVHDEIGKWGAALRDDGTSPK